MSDKFYKNLKLLFDNKKLIEFEKAFLTKYETKVNLCEKSYNLYAIYLLTKKKFEEAKKFLKKSISVNNLFYEAKLNLAALNLHLKEEISETEHLLLDILKTNKNNSRAFHLLYDLNFNLNNFKNCIVYCENFLTSNPVDAYAFNKLGVAYYKLFNYEKAIHNFKTAAQLNSNNFDFSFNLFKCYKNQKNFIKSQEILNYLANKFPREKKILYELANLYRGLGEFKKSDDILEKIVSESLENNYLAVYQLLLSPKYPNQHQLSEKVELNYVKYDDKFKEIVGYGLFKYFDRNQIFDKASKYLKESIKISSQRLNYNCDYDLKLFNFFKKTFNQDFFLKHKVKKKLNTDEIKNIFIVGLHRSGSTLVEQILSTQASLVSLGETSVFPDLITKYFPNQELKIFENTLNKVNSDEFVKIGEDYLKNVNFKNKTITLDKQLSNFRLLGLVFLSLPDSFVIHVKRLKNDHLISILSNYYAGDHAPWSCDIENLLEYYKLYEDLMAHWQSLFPERIINIQYEDLIASPQKTISIILDKINLSWNETFLDFQNNKNIVETQSAFQVREKIYDNSIGRWKFYEQYFHSLFK